jgi:hypothetical protein
MANKTVIKYNVEGMRMFKVPIIKIIPNNTINIKLSFPNISDINIDTNNIVVIHQKQQEQYNVFNLYANDKIISNKNGLFDNGTIIITGNCNVEETYQMIYDS